MSIITLRGLNSEAEKKAKRNAARRGKSMNRFLVDLIEDQVLGDQDGKPHEYDDLDHLFGSMTHEDAKIIDKSVKEQRKIDPELWK